LPTAQRAVSPRHRAETGKNAQKRKLKILDFATRLTALAELDFQSRANEKTYKRSARPRRMFKFALILLPERILQFRARGEKS
jgi:hypothetical protein